MCWKTPAPESRRRARNWPSRNFTVCEVPTWVQQLASLRPIPLRSSEPGTPHGACRPPMKRGRPAPARGSGRLRTGFLQAPVPSGCTVSTVRSSDSTSILTWTLSRRRNSARTRSRTPLFAQRFIRVWIVGQVLKCVSHLRPVHPSSAVETLAAGPLAWLLYRRPSEIPSRAIALPTRLTNLRDLRTSPARPEKEVDFRSTIRGSMRDSRILTREHHANPRALGKRGADRNVRARNVISYQGHADVGTTAVPSMRIPECHWGATRNRINPPITALPARPGANPALIRLRDFFCPPGSRRIWIC